MKYPTLLFWSAAALYLTACGGGQVPGSTPAPPPDLSIFDQGKGAQPVVESGKDEPDRRAVSREDQPYVVGWVKPGVTKAQQLADTEACYDFAWAQVNKDIRIDDDIAAARGKVGSQFFPLTAATQPADNFYYRKERIVRLEKCMRDKGYTSQ